MIQPSQRSAISAEMRVREVLNRHPQAAEVFLKHGCPDMRKGFFALMARIMRVRWAAFVHRIPCDRLVADLNATLVAGSESLPPPAQPP